MVLNLHRKALVRRSSGRSLGYGPTLEDAVQLQAKVVVQVRSAMLLDDENQLLSPPVRSRARLRRRPKIAFPAVGGQRHPLPPNVFFVEAVIL
jgi:hypothetical protein